MAAEGGCGGGMFELGTYMGRRTWVAAEECSEKLRWEGGGYIHCGWAKRRVLCPCERRLDDPRPSGGRVAGECDGDTRGGESVCSPPRPSLYDIPGCTTSDARSHNEITIAPRRPRS